MRLLCGRQDVQANPRSGGRRKTVDLLMSNGAALGHRAPLFAVPYLDSIMLDVLSVVQPLHRQGAVERDLLRKIHLNR